MNTPNWTWPGGQPPLIRYWLMPLAAAVGLMLMSAPENLNGFLLVNKLARHLPDSLWSIATILGDSLVVLCLLLPLLRKRPDLVVACLIAALPAALISHGLKDLVDSPRPPAVLGDAVHIIGHLHGGPSFPSSHTTSAFVLAGVLIMGLRSQALAWLIALLAIIVGISRVAVGAHWPADILGGMLVGWISAFVGVWLNKGLALELHAGVRRGMHIVLSLCALALLLLYDDGYPLARPFEEALAVMLLLAAWVPPIQLRHLALKH